MSMWNLELFEAEDGTIPYERFVADLPDFKFIALKTAVEHVLVVRGIDLARTEWLKALGDGLYEFRVRHSAQEIARMFGDDLVGHKPARQKVLLRVFVHFYGNKIVLLLGGYDKGDDPNERRQRREIAMARKLLTQFRERRRRARRATHG